MTTPKMLYHAPYELGALTSGSRVRPYYMLQAFKQLGYDVTIISGDVTRRKTLVQALDADTLSRFDFCYSEPSTYPVHPVWDYCFYWKLHRAGVPLGIFYRDAYWKLVPEWGEKSRVKEAIVYARHMADLQLFGHIAEAVFFPTQMLADKISVGTGKAVLLPGGRLLSETVTRRPHLTPPYTVVYVGTMNTRYGSSLLLETLELLNEWRPVILEAVCHRADVESQPDLFARYRDAPWLKLHHVHGDALEAIYNRGHVAIIPILRNPYNDLAMPVKLFEYMSYGLPMVVTNCTEMERFVSRTGIGLVADDTPEALAAQVQRLLDDAQLYGQTVAAVTETLADGNLWVSRTQTVVDRVVSSAIKSD